MEKRDSYINNIVSNIYIFFNGGNELNANALDKIENRLEKLWFQFDCAYTVKLTNSY